MTQESSLAAALGCLADYDPEALPVASARQVIERVVAPVRAIERLPLRCALDRVLASDLLSPIDVPASDNSAMDGYAFRSSDLVTGARTELKIVGSAFAGRPCERAVGRGEAVRIMTGAVMPDGCDTVLPQELAAVQDDLLGVPAGQRPGQHRRRRGEDLAAGSPALRQGRRLSPADLGLLASLGMAEVPVRRRLRVAFFSTGDELRSLGEPLPPGHVYDSNRYTIHGMLGRLGVDAIDLGVVRDDPRALEEAMRVAAASADAIISSGGVSVGEADFTREVMGRLGEVAFWKIAMRPGRPLAFGRIGDAAYFGLPGNPVAVMISFYFFARDALLRMMGAAPVALPQVRARASGPIRKRPGRTEYQRGILRPAPDGKMEVRLTGSQGSGVLRSMSEANCIVVLDHDRGEVAAGDEVDCLAFDGLV